MMKKYISPGSWCSFEYPRSWHEFEDEEGSFLFYNPSMWTGNFRISASMDASNDFAQDIMRDELAQYADAKLVELGGKEFVYSRETFQEGDEWYTSHFWVTGYRNMVVYATFTTKKGGDISEPETVLGTLKLLDPKMPNCHEYIDIRLMEIALINGAYERIQKEVKNELKKDFSNVDTATGIALLQRMLDEGKMKLNPSTWERIAYVLGCFLVGEVENIQWVTRIEGREEFPELVFCMETKENSRTVNPVEYLISNHVSPQGKCNLSEAYEGLLSAIVS